MMRLVTKMDLFLLALSAATLISIVTSSYSSISSVRGHDLDAFEGDASVQAEVVFLYRRPVRFRVSSVLSLSTRFSLYDYDGMVGWLAGSPVSAVVVREFTSASFFTFTPERRGYFLLVFENLSDEPSTIELLYTFETGKIEPDMLYDAVVLMSVSLALLAGGFAYSRLVDLKGKPKREQEGRA